MNGEFSDKSHQKRPAVIVDANVVYPALPEVAQITNPQGVAADRNVYGAQLSDGECIRGVCGADIVVAVAL